MSSRATIVDTPGTHIYHETNNSRYAFDKFIGYDIDVIIGRPDWTSVTFKEGMLSIVVPAHSQLHATTGPEIRMYGNHLYDIEVTPEHVSFSITAGTLSADMVNAGAYTPTKHRG